MAFVSSVWLAYEFWRLTWQSPPIWPGSPKGAVDLILRHEEVHRWFSGAPVYGEKGTAIYPPASYLMLWPFLGWLGETPARWLWAVSLLAVLVLLVRLVVKESGANSKVEILFIGLLPLSMYATGAAIGNGQLIVHLMLALIAGLLLLERPKRWGYDLLIAALFLAALVKPSVTAPFFWLVLVLPGGFRPAVLISIGYATLVLFSARYQEPDVVSLLGGWLRGGLDVALDSGGAHLYSLLTSLKLADWALPLSFLLLIVLGIWTYVHRKADTWLLMGVVAIFSRFWMYHNWYDDLLLLLPMVALFRIARGRQTFPGSDVVAGLLLAIMVVSTLAPGGLYLFPPPWNSLYVAAQTIVWLILLFFLLHQAWLVRNAPLANEKLCRKSRLLETR